MLTWLFVPQLVTVYPPAVLEEPVLELESAVESDEFESPVDMMIEDDKSVSETAFVGGVLEVDGADRGVCAVDVVVWDAVLPQEVEVALYSSWRRGAEDMEPISFHHLPSPS